MPTVQSASECETCLHQGSEWCEMIVDQPAAQNSYDRGPDWHSHRVVGPGERIVSCGDMSASILVLSAGWGYRFLALPDGRRQILNFLLPGDPFALNSLSETRFDCSVDALTEAHIVAFRREDVNVRIDRDKGRNGRWEEAISRQLRSSKELMFAIGQGTSEERVAHLILHLVRRLPKHGPKMEGRYHLPIKLPHIADTIGLTSEHVCRVLTRFRKRRIFGLSHGCLEIFDPDALERAGHLDVMPTSACDR